jgi:hypothetical protein
MKKRSLYFENKSKFKKVKIARKVKAPKPGNPNAAKFNPPIKSTYLQNYFLDENCPRTSEENGNLKVFSTGIPNRATRKSMMGQAKMPNSGNRKMTRGRKKTYLMVNKFIKVKKITKNGFKIFYKKVQVSLIHVYNKFR